VQWSQQLVPSAPSCRGRPALVSAPPGKAIRTPSGRRQCFFFRQGRGAALGHTPSACGTPACPVGSLSPGTSGSVVVGCLSHANRIRCGRAACVKHSSLFKVKLCLARGICLPLRLALRPASQLRAAGRHGAIGWVVDSSPAAHRAPWRSTPAPVCLLHSELPRCKQSTRGKQRSAKGPLGAHLFPDVGIQLRAF